MSLKYTGITSAGSAIPVYDKDAHNALEQKLDIAVYSAASGEFATHEEVESATSGKADLSGVIEYSNKPESGAIHAGGNSLANVHAIFGESDSSALRIVPSDLLQVPNIITATPAGVTANGLSVLADSAYGGVSANGLTAGPNANFVIQGPSETFSSNRGAGFVFSSVNTGFGSAQLTLANPNVTVQMASPKFEAKNISGAGFSIEGSAAKGYDHNGNVTWDTTKPAKLIGWSNYQGAVIDPRANGIDGSIIASVLPDQIPSNMSLTSAPYTYMNGFGVSACFPGGSKLSIDTNTLTIGGVFPTVSSTAAMNSENISYSKYNNTTSATDVWTLTGSIQKREIEGDSATSAITAIAGSAIGGGGGGEFPQSASEAIEAVTANSGAWGGSALPISAGPGVKVDLVDNTLVFRNDETVLWEGTLSTTAESATLNESWKNFDSLRIYCAPGNQAHERPPIIHNISIETISADGHFYSYLPVFNIASNTCTAEVLYVTGSNNGTTIGMLGGTRSVNFATATTGVSSYNTTVKKIVGINRISGGN